MIYDRKYVGLTAWTIMKNMPGMTYQAAYELSEEIYRDNDIDVGYKGYTNAQ